MAYIVVEASVRTHRKFLAAGPAASWLWLCGLGYCQDGLTDGFIPKSAIEFLGVKGAAKLAPKLVAVGLWEEDRDGWQMHDYLDHNKSAKEIRSVMRRRAEGGVLGGRPSKTSKVSKENQQGLQTENLTENPLLISPTGTSGSSGTTRTEEAPAPEDGRVLTEGGAWRLPGQGHQAHRGGLVNGRDIRRHAGHLAGCNRDKCVDEEMHAGHCRAYGVPDADRRLREWYPTVLAKYEGQPIGDDRYTFWRNELAHFLGTVTKKPTAPAGKGSATVSEIAAAVQQRAERAR